MMVLSVGAVTLLAAQAPAALIQFEQLKPLANYSYIPDGYGSTPELAVSYRSLNGNLSVATSHLQFWNEGYGSLPAVAYPDGNGRYGEVTLTPAAGRLAVLKSFEMAAYPTGTGTRTEAVISVLYGDQVVNYGPFELPRNTVAHFTPNVSHAGPVTLRFGTDWDNGINNLQVETVAERTTYLDSPSLTNAFFRFLVHGPVGSNVIVQVSTDLTLTNWSPVLTNSIPTEGSVAVLRARSKTQPWAFYRAVVP